MGVWGKTPRREAFGEGEGRRSVPRMFHPFTEVRFIREEIGLGVVATRRLPRGTVVWVADPFDLSVSEAERVALHPLYQAALQRFAYRDEHGRWWQSWDHGRYVNHSCDANTLCGAHGISVVTRDIEVGEEVTEDWAWNNRDLGVPCRCGAAACRGRVGAGDGHARLAQWERAMREVYPRVLEVEQALWDLVAHKDLLRDEISGARPMATYAPLLMPLDPASP